MRRIATVFSCVFLAAFIACFQPADGSTLHSSDFRMKIQFSGYQAAETLTNFPALVMLGTNIPGFSYSQFFSPANAGDLRFMNSNLTVELNYEIERWNTNIVATVVPTDIPGCILWLKADSGAETNADGTVYQWTDQSGSGNDVTQVTGGAQPRYVENVVNGLPVIRFDGSSDRMTNSNAGGAFDLTNAAVFVVLAPDYTTPGYSPGYFGVRNTGTRMSLHVNSERTQWRAWNDSSVSAYNHVFEQNEFVVIGTVWDGPEERVFVNGASVITSTNHGWNVARSNQTVNVGSSYSNEYMQADITEVLVYDRTLADAESVQIGLYLARKYGLETSPYAAEKSCVWVQVPELAGNTCIWAYWGNKNGTNVPAYCTNGATWSDEYAGVWHLNEPVTDESLAGIYADSSSNRNIGLQYNTASAVGMAGFCAWFDGDDFISVTNESAYDFNDQVTVSAWIRVDGGWNTAWQMFVTKGSDQNWDLRRLGGTEQISFCLNNSNRVGVATNMANGEWHQLSAVYRQSPLDARVYYDGQLYYVDPAPPPLLTANNEPLRISGRNSGGYNHRGLIDEVEVSRTYRSSNWVWACYLNQASNSVFASYGPVQRIPKGTVIVIR